LGLPGGRKRLHGSRLTNNVWGHARLRQLPAADLTARGRQLDSQDSQNLYVALAFQNAPGRS
jgi:hypothetical protein